MDTATGKLVATEGESGDVNLFSSDTKHTERKGRRASAGRPGARRNLEHKSQKHEARLKRSGIKDVWISGHTKTGSVLQVKDIFSFDQHGIETQVPSTSGDG